MELDEFSLAVCQPEKNGHYECCRIFYEEIDRIVEAVAEESRNFTLCWTKTKTGRAFSFWTRKSRTGRSSLSARLDLIIRGLRSFIGAPLECSRKNQNHWNEEPGGMEPSKTKYRSLHCGRNDCLLCDSETPGSYEATLGGTGL